MFYESLTRNEWGLVATVCAFFLLLLIFMLWLKGDLSRFRRSQKEELDSQREEIEKSASEMRLLLNQMNQLDQDRESTQRFQFLDLIQKSSNAQSEKIDQLQTSITQYLQGERTLQEKRLGTLATGLSETLNTMRSSMNEQLHSIRETNDKSLSEMRKTVEEKLQETLNTRISASFKEVETQLTEVYKGLGEMREMAQNVDGLRRVLTNVKTRGCFGEMQLGMILSQVLTPDQYDTNVKTRPGSNDPVEFAIKLPGKTEEQPFVYLPIDAKFPMEDYERLMRASDACDPVAQAEAIKGLESRILSEAKKIRDKYVEVPYTTEFAVLYLPVESLYAEVLKVPGLIDRVQREMHITVSGPTVLAALLNSLQMGFRTLAIEKKSAEVWHVLGQVKAEFAKFDSAMESMDKKIGQMKSTLEDVRKRTRVMGKKLKDVESIETLAVNDSVQVEDQTSLE